MGCFIACFGASKHQKSHKSPTSTLSADQYQIHENCEPLQPTKPVEEQNTDHSIEPLLQSECKKKEEQLRSCIKKKVTFDLIKDTHQDASVQRVAKRSCGSEEEKEKEREAEEDSGNEGQILSEEQVNSCIEKKVISYMSTKETHEDVSGQEVAKRLCGSEKEEEKEKQVTEESLNEGLIVSESSTSSMISYPTNHGYYNCSRVDDENKDTDIQESSESLFSLSIESRKQGYAVEADDKEVNSPIPVFTLPRKEMKNGRFRSQYVHSVLNPIKNLSQWKAVESKTNFPQSKDQGKENILGIPYSEEPSLKLVNRWSKLKENEVAVDTSLSSWLVKSEQTPMAKESSPSCSVGNSSRSFEDRPILGALTVEELKQLSASLSPRRSPRRSPDEIPIIGTVGSYWSHTGQTMDSDSGSSCKGMSGTSEKGSRVYCPSTPFGKRFERALDTGTA